MEQLLAYLDGKEKTSNNRVLLLAEEFDDEGQKVVGKLSDEHIKNYLNTIGTDQNTLHQAKPLIEWTDSDLMVFLSYHEVESSILLKLLDKKIGGWGLLQGGSIQTVLIKEGIEESKALVITKLLERVGM